MPTHVATSVAIGTKHRMASPTLADRGSGLIYGGRKEESTMLVDWELSIVAKGKS